MENNITGNALRATMEMDSVIQKMLKEKKEAEGTVDDITTNLYDASSVLKCIEDFCDTTLPFGNPELIKGSALDFCERMRNYHGALRCAIHCIEFESDRLAELFPGTVSEEVASV